MNRKKSFGILLVGIFMLITLMACKPTEKPDPVESHVFEFAGNLVVNEVTYKTTLLGYDDESFELEVDGFDPIPGTYEIIGGKGYVFYFHDYTESIKKTSWDQATKEFSLKYTIDLGSSRGKGEAILTCKDETFVETDANEWPFIPFTFYGETQVMGIADVTTTITMFEDGTASVTGTTTAGVFSARDGVWEFDSETNVYKFVLDPLDAMGGPVGTEFETTFDEATNTYSLELDIVIVMGAKITVTYVVE